jgi:hypothetical protein
MASTTGDTKNSVDAADKLMLKTNDKAVVTLPGFRPPSDPTPEASVESISAGLPPLHVEVFDGIFPLDMTKYPNCCVGKVICGIGTPGNMIQRTNIGTGVLVGTNLVLTACHILPIGQSSPLVRFIPGYTAGEEPFGHYDTTVWTMLPAPGQVNQVPSGIDAAILFLPVSLQAKCGYFGWQSSGNPEAYVGSWFSTGYPQENWGGERAITWGAQVTDVNTDNEASGTDFELITPGYASGPFVGAPLWHSGPDLFPYVNGVVSGNRDGRTVHSAGPLLASFLQKARSEQLP